MKLVKPNWYGIDHAAVARKFEGNPVFLNDFCIRGEYKPTAVYYCARPNKRKKHRTFVLLTETDHGMVIRGMSPREMKKYRFQAGLHCLKCDDVIYSVMRHDFRHCSCSNVSVDGGKDYFKVGHTADASFKMVKIDLVTDKII